MEKDAKIYVAGHSGLVGSALVRALERAGYTNLVRRTHDELDLIPGLGTQQVPDEEGPDEPAPAGDQDPGFLWI